MADEPRRAEPTLRVPALTRRTALTSLTMLAASGSRAWTADGYPRRPISLVIAFPAGGGADLAGRIIASALETALDGTIVPINKPGAGGLIAANFVRNARPDGYTMLFATSNFSINTVVRPDAVYNPITDFTPIGMLGRATYILIASSASGLKSLDDLVAAAKSRPGTLKFGSPGIGVSGQLVGDLLRHMARIDFQDIRYKGNSEAVTAAMSGEVDFAVDSSSIVAPNIATGRLVALGATGDAPDLVLPDVPLIAQTYPGFSVWTWLGLCGPANMPADVLTVLGKAIRKASQEQTLIGRMKENGFQMFVMDQPQFIQYLKDDTARWLPIATKGI